MYTKNFEKFEERVFLATPTMHGEELKYIQEAYDTNWMTTAGTNINEVETKVNLIMEKIKQTGYLKMNEDAENQDTFKEFDELMFMIRKRYTKGT